MLRFTHSTLAINGISTVRDILTVLVYHVLFQGIEMYGFYSSSRGVRIVAE